jgi:hypothetical protein
MEANNAAACRTITNVTRLWASIQAVVVSRAMLSHVKLNPLILSATIYGPDAQEFVPCSSTVLEFAHIGVCYNASWVYYSIDTCIPPTPTVSPLSPTSTPNEAKTSSKSHTGAIVGGVVGGVGGLALIGLAFFLIYRRRRNKKRALEQPPTAPLPPSEAPGTNLNELPQEDVKPEIYTSEAKPQEIGRNSLYIPDEQPPAELEGSAAVQQEKRDV